MLSTFLNLQCQFSRIVFEKFSGMLLHMKDDTILGSNGYFPEAGIRSQASPNVSPHRPTPSPPNGGLQYSPFGSTNSSPHQFLPQQQIFFQQQQQQLLLQQQLLQMAQQQQQLMHLNSKKHPISENLKEETSSRQSNSGGGNSLGYASYSGAWNGSPGHSQQPQCSSPNYTASHGSGNTLSPGLHSTFSGVSSFFKFFIFQFFIFVSDNYTGCSDT